MKVISQTKRARSRKQIYKMLMQNTHFPKNQDASLKLEKKAKGLENQIFGDYYNNQEQYNYWTDKIKTFLQKIQKYRQISRTLHRKEFQFEHILKFSKDLSKLSKVETQYEEKKIKTNNLYEKNKNNSKDEDIYQETESEKDKPNNDQKQINRKQHIGSFDKVKKQLKSSEEKLIPKLLTRQEDNKQEEPKFKQIKQQETRFKLIKQEENKQQEESKQEEKKQEETKAIRQIRKVQELLSLGSTIIKTYENDVITPALVTFDDPNKLKNFPSNILDQLEIDAFNTQPVQNSIEFFETEINNPNYVFVTGWMYIPDLIEAKKLQQLGIKLKEEQLSVQMSFYEEMLGITLFNNSQIQKKFQTQTKWVILNDQIKDSQYMGAISNYQTLELLKATVMFALYISNQGALQMLREMDEAQDHIKGKEIEYSNVFKIPGIASVINREKQKNKLKKQEQLKENGQQANNQEQQEQNKEVPQESSAID